MCPVLVGWVSDDFDKLRDGAGVITGYNYSIPMAVVAVFGICAIVISVMLRMEDAKKHYGLEEANMKKG